MVCVCKAVGDGVDFLEIALIPLLFISPSLG